MSKTMSNNGEHDDLTRLLDEVGRREAEERRAGDALEDAPGLHDVERVLEEVWGSSPPKRAWRWPLYLGLLAAAAAVIGLMLFRLESPQKVTGPAGELLGDGDLVIHRPAASPGQWPDHVAWSGPKGLEYVLRIVEYADGAEGRELFAPRAIIAFEQPLPAEVTRSWPDKIKLLLEARNKEGAEQGAAEAIWERSR
ncbi:MAG: hypothetical protein ACKVXR_08555 [Planctomycetota bacterium]